MKHNFDSKTKFDPKSDYNFLFFFLLNYQLIYIYIVKIILNKFYVVHVMQPCIKYLNIWKQKKYCV